MPIELKRFAGNVPMHVLTEDAHESLPDGRQVLVGRAGQQIPLVRAQQLGLVATGPEVTPGEAKAPRPGGKKAKADPPADPS